MILTASVAVRFCLLRAWPVVAFSLFEVPLIGVLLAINMRRARASELIMLDAQKFTVIRTDPAGRRRQVSLPSAWLRVDLAVVRGISRLILSSRDRNCEVGSFLHEPEKLSLRAALSDALHRLRNPHFDNPQLRDGVGPATK
jgi:uncharacterized membrane protein